MLPKRDIHDPNNVVDISMSTPTIKIDDRIVNNFSLNMKGTVAQHQLQLTGHYQKRLLDVLLSGDLKGTYWQGTLNRLKIDQHLWQHPLEAHLKLDKNAPYKFTGMIQTQINNLKSLAMFNPDFAHYNGKLKANIQLQGTLSNPSWQGDIILSEAKIRAAHIGNKAYIHELRATILANQQFTLNGKGSWGTGLFSLDGSGSLLTQSLKLHFKGDQLLLSDTSEYTILANPDLHFTVEKGSLFASGSIVVPKARIQTMKSPQKSISKDVVIISKQSSPPKTLIENTLYYPINIDIMVTLGQEVWYKGFGVNTQVNGAVQITQAARQTPKAKGKLKFNQGKYSAYGKTFDIAYGHLLFTGGPIYEPMLDIKAQREIKATSTLGSFQNSQPVLAGIQLLGKIKSPKISFYSQPAMKDADVISYLIVGKPQNKMSESQSELLFEAVTQLAGMVSGKSSDEAFNLGKKLNLDQIGFSQKPNYTPPPTGMHNPLEDTMFVLGKQLSDKLFLNYSVGLIDSASIVGLRYNLGKNLTLEAATGTQGSSADVVLSLEGN